jgi:hypothetical protein
MVCRGVPWMARDGLILWGALSVTPVVGSPVPILPTFTSMVFVYIIKMTVIGGTE